MNYSPPAPSGGGFLGTQDIGVSAYGIGVTIGILLLIITIALASCYCARTPPSAISVVGQRPLEAHDSSTPALEIGVDESILMSYPKVLYSQAKVKNKNSTATCCSICLADYKGNDMLRVLPDCGHLFHLNCVDPWLRQHPTCPVCRTSPMPTPLATPLAEVVLLASRPMSL